MSGHAGGILTVRKGGMKCGVCESQNAKCKGQSHPQAVTLTEVRTTHPAPKFENFSLMSFELRTSVSNFEPKF